MDARQDLAESTGPSKLALPVPCEHSRLLLLIRGICTSFSPELNVDHVLETHAGSELELLEQLWHTHVMGMHEEFPSPPDAHMEVLSSNTLQTFQLTPEVVSGDTQQALHLTPESASRFAEERLAPAASEGPSAVLPSQGQHPCDHMWWVSCHPARALPDREAVLHKHEVPLSAAVDAETQAFLDLLQGCEPGDFSNQPQAVLGALHPESVKCTLEAVDLHVTACIEAELLFSSSTRSGNVSDFRVLAAEIVAKVSAETALYERRALAMADAPAAPALPLWWAVASDAPVDSTDLMPKPNFTWHREPC